MSSFCDFRNKHSNRRLEFHKRPQLFIRTHNETLSVVAMRVCSEIVRPLESIAEPRPNSIRL